MYTKFFKRLIDIVLSGCALIVLSPLYLILILAIKIDSPGPVLFKQKRVCFLQVLFAESCKLKIQNVALWKIHSFAS